jgi:hypothetical protein
MTNAGTAAAAGVVPGAWLGRPGASNAVAGESGLSRSLPGGGAVSPAGQWGLVCALTGGAGRTSNDERADG